MKIQTSKISTEFIYCKNALTSSYETREKNKKSTYLYLHWCSAQYNQQQQHPHYHHHDDDRCPFASSWYKHARKKKKPGELITHHHHPFVDPPSSIIIKCCSSSCFPTWEVQILGQHHRRSLLWRRSCLERWYEKISNFVLISNQRFKVQLQRSSSLVPGQVLRLGYFPVIGTEAYLSFDPREVPERQKKHEKGKNP